MKADIYNLDLILPITSRMFFKINVMRAKLTNISEKLYSWTILQKHLLAKARVEVAAYEQPKAAVGGVYHPLIGFPLC